MGYAFKTALSKGRTPNPDDLYLEFFADTTDGGTDSSLTLQTDTSIIGRVLWMYPVTKDTTPAAVSAATLGTAPAFKGEASTIHNVYMIGGRAVSSTNGQIPDNKFTLKSAIGGSAFKGGQVYWEIVKKTLSGGTATITASSDCQVVRRILYAMPVHITTSAPVACGVSSITGTTAVLRGDTTAVIWTLVGGYSADETVASGTALPQTYPMILEASRFRRPGDLVGEVITKTLDAASPSKVTITAASDCAIVRHIQFVIPVSNKATVLTVGWAGTQGPTSIIYAANGETSTVNCLVLGR